MKKVREDLIIKTGSNIVLSILLVLGAYIILHGHLSPGGGFQGGVLLAGGVALYYLINKNGVIFNNKGALNKFKWLENLSAVAYLVFGVLGVVLGGVFFQNIVSKGMLGELFSSGTIFLMNFSVGAKVLFGVGFLILILLSTLKEEGEEQ